MSALRVSRPHALAPEVLRARVERAADAISARFGADCTWDGDVLRIAHASVTGSVTLGPKAVDVEAELGFPLAMFKGRAKSEIERILDKELGA